MSTLRLAFVKLFGWSLLGLFLLPLLTWWVSGHGLDNMTAELRAGLHSALAQKTDLDAPSRAMWQALADNATARGICDGSLPQLDYLVVEVCGASGDVGQFLLAKKVSVAMLWLGLGSLLWIAAVVGVAYFRPRLQLSAFSAGWWSLRAVSAVEVLVQAAMLVWLSYWITALFFSIYVPKLIIIAAVLAAMGAWIAISAIFKRVKMDNAISGVPIPREQAPALWARVGQCAAKLGTAPPQQIIAGIDASFFVTEAPLRLPQGEVRGRSLFVSLPLLRLLSRNEADAVLAHEMAHFSGGDTAFSAALGPKLVAYAHYLGALSQNLLTVLASFALNLFRAAFELALSNASRAREFAADKAAADLVSGDAIARSLIKVSAYSAYRNTVEQSLFEQRERHEGPLDLAGRVAHGLVAFAHSPDFQSAVAQAGTPHPFDSHPPLQQRMQQVGAVYPTSAFAGIVESAPADTWTDLIHDVASMEASLWQQYESNFAAEHEQQLAYRYEPANEAELAIVLRYFPGVEIAQKKGGVIRISYRGVETPDTTLDWDQVSRVQYDDGSFGTSDTLTITHPERGTLGMAKSTKLKLALSAQARESFKQSFGRYWQRHQIMRKLQAGS
ncbi:MAG: M48 family metalloprotease [Rhodanobacteraceae bacterium]|nr:M48 family metalloprotease [Rhodanobacteraceae bacterium]